MVDSAALLEMVNPYRIEVAAPRNMKRLTIISTMVNERTNLRSCLEMTDGLWMTVVFMRRMVCYGSITIR